MKKIMLVCSAGMSTSLLVEKMKKSASTKGIEAEIFACSEVEGKRKVDEVDVILIGPQVRFIKKDFEKIAKCPVDVIVMRDYGLVNGENVLDHALSLLK